MSYNNLYVIKKGLCLYLSKCGFILALGQFFSLDITVIERLDKFKTCLDVGNIHVANMVLKLSTKQNIVANETNEAVISDEGTALFTAVASRGARA